MLNTPVSFRNLIIGVDTLVPLLDGRKVPYINLDNAASTPAMLPVQQAVDRFLQYYSSVHRGTGFKSQLSTHFYEEARKAVMRFVGANPADHACIFSKNSTMRLSAPWRRSSAVNSMVRISRILALVNFIRKPGKFDSKIILTWEGIDETTGFRLINCHCLGRRRLL